jgi:hypothetical protein
VKSTNQEEADTRLKLLQLPRVLLPLDALKLLIHTAANQKEEECMQSANHEEAEQLLLDSVKLTIHSAVNHKADLEYSANQGEAEPRLQLRLQLRLLLLLLLRLVQLLPDGVGLGLARR